MSSGFHNHLYQQRLSEAVDPDELRRMAMTIREQISSAPDSAVAELEALADAIVALDSRLDRAADLLRAVERFENSDCVSEQVANAARNFDRSF